MKRPRALILGVSSGFGKATALELAKKGYGIYGVHLDFGAGKKQADELLEELSSLGVEVKFFNRNAADDAVRNEVIDAIKKDFEQEPDAELRVLMHSLAFGAIGPFIVGEGKSPVNRRKMEMTLNVMANSLLYWAQDVFDAGLLKENARIIAMTSAGSYRAMKNYGPISVAKAALEAYIRQLAVEMAPFKITANAILAGLTDTPAAQKIPGFNRMLEFAREQNPYRRNTVPEDVAQTISLIIDEKSYWVTGQVLGVDGGESILNFIE